MRLGVGGESRTETCRGQLLADWAVAGNGGEAARCGTCICTRGPALSMKKVNKICGFKLDLM